MGRSPPTRGRSLFEKRVAEAERPPTRASPCAPTAATAEEAFDRVNLLLTKGTIALRRCDAATAGRSSARRSGLRSSTTTTSAPPRRTSCWRYANLLFLPVAEIVDGLRRARPSWWRGRVCARCRPIYVSMLAYMSVEAGDWARARRLIDSASRCSSRTIRPSGRGGSSTRPGQAARRQGELESWPAARTPPCSRSGLTEESARFADDAREGAAVPASSPAIPGALELCARHRRFVEAHRGGGEAEVDAVGSRSPCWWPPGTGAGGRDRGLGRRLLPGHPYVRCCQALVGCPAIRRVRRRR